MVYSCDTSIGFFLIFQNPKNGNSPLHEAVTGIPDWPVDPDFISFLVKDCRLDVNAETFTEVTPLHISSAKGDTRVAQVLIQNDANENALDSKGHLPKDYYPAPVLE